MDNVKRKLLLPAEAKQLVDQWKNEGDKVVFTNGCFDLLHLGHLTYLAQAADLGQRFIIGVNTDASVKRQGKSPSRPIKDEESRALLLASMEFVDGIVLFEDDTPYSLIETIVPNVLVKGGDYDPAVTDVKDKKYIVGSDVVRQNGGEVKVLDFVPGHSTTKLEQKILKELS